MTSRALTGPAAHPRTERTIRLELPLLLPEIKDVRDACVERLVRLLELRGGVQSAHVVGPDEAAGDGTPIHGEMPPSQPGEAQLCLHYDPDRLTLSEVTALARAAGAEVTDRYGHVVVPFRAVSTEDGGRRLEEELRALKGVTAASVNFAGQVARVEFDRRRVDRAAIEARLRAAGATVPADVPVTPDAAPAGAREARNEAETQEHPEGDSWYARNRELAWSLASGVLLAVGWLVGRLTGAPSVVPIGFYVAAYVFGARDNVGHFIGDLRRGKFHFNIDLLMVVAALGAAILGAWLEGALLLFLFSLGHALEHYALGRARNAIAALAELAPQTATVVREGQEAVVPIADVRRGDLVVVKPAERIPVDGTVREGRSAVNQAPITGESVPVDKAPEEPVFAGSVNGNGALVIEVTVAIGDRTLDRVIRLVAEAQTQKAPTQQFTDRFERVFVPLVLVADLLLIVVPPLLGIWTWGDAFYRGMALLVAASPCALALGTPAAVLAGIAQAARKGVLIKGGAYLEVLGSVDTLALDKTGTITRGEPVVTDLRPAEGIGEDRLLALTAAVERRSQHPLARAILEAAEQRGLAVPAAGELESVTGRGIRATVDGAMVEVGRLLMFEEAGDEVPATVRASAAALEKAGRTTVVVRRRPTAGADAAPGAGDGWLGVIGVADEPRPGVRETLDRLRAVGIRRIVMLTGDNAGVGNAVGSAVGVDEVRAGLLPEDKVTAIEELAREGRVAMVGDGVNDAPALAHATVGIAMGGAGTAAALETADVALMADDLGRLPFAIGLSRSARRIIKQNLALSLGVIALLVVATTTGVVGIGPAVVVHEGSTLVVIANALRLLAYGRSEDT
ncbi:MAG TPA: heavy metal translocating P-type ATPase [Gemmatimonadales bacterium]